MPTTPANVKPPKTTELGDSGLMVMNTLVKEAEYNSDLQGKKGIREFNKMRISDTTIGAALAVLFLPILSTTWRIDDAGETRKDKEVGDFVRKNIFEGMTRTWQETLQEILLYIPLGVMPFELVWDFDDEGRTYLRKFASRFPTSIEEWQTESKEDGIQQYVGLKRVSIPIEKLCIFVRNKEGDNWWGRSALRGPYGNWYVKKKLIIIDAMAHERQGLGIAYAKKPTGAKDEDIETVRDLLRSITANEESHLIWPEGWELGFMDMKAGTIKSPVEAIKYHDHAMLLSFLAQFLNLAAGDGGSFALNESQQKLLLLSLQSIANYIRDTFQQYAIKKLVDFNFEVEKYPTLQYKEIGDVDLAVWTEALSKMIDKGVVEKDENVERVTRDNLDLPERDGSNFSPEEMDAMLSELENEPVEEQVEDPNNPGFDMEGNPMVTEEEVTEAAELMDDDQLRVYGGAKGQPLSEETKRKISEALKKGKGGAGKGKKKANPQAVAKKKEIAQIRKEMKDYANSIRKEELERRAKGEKLDDQAKAKRELEVFNKKTEFNNRIDKLKSEVEALNATPAKEDKKASETSNPLLLQLSAQVKKMYHALTNRPTTD